MLWDAGRERVAAAVPPAYELDAIPNERLAEARAVIELDGALTNAQWESFADRVLPDGLFVARERSSGEAIGTVSAVHNPRGGRFHFPGGGEIGYLVVAELHRGRGVGSALVAAAVRRLRAAGYRHIWLGVQELRLPAIRTYLGAGFLPFLHPPDPDELEARWARVFGELQMPADSRDWRWSSWLNMHS